MAEVEKTLNNVESTVRIDPEELNQEIETAEEEKAKAGEPVDVVENEDGSVDINYDPAVAAVDQGEDHFSNLAELLPEDVLSSLSSELMSNYQDYKMSRKDWEKSYIEGLDLLGFKYNNRIEPFKNASGSTCLLYTSPSPRDRTRSRMPSSA